MRHRIAGLLVALLLGPAIPGAAAAETSPASALTAWVAGIDATPDWAAGFLTLSYDPTTRTAAMSGFSLRAERGSIAFTVDKIAIVGYAASADGGFTATSIKADGGTAEFGFMKVAVSDVDLTDIAMPAIEAVAYDPARPFSSWLKVLAGIAKAKLASGRIGVLSLIQTVEGIDSRIAYENLTIDRLAGGKIASVRAGPLTMQSPAPEGLAGITVAAAETSDIDLSAFLRIYDPDAYVGGTGDLVWHQAIGRASYRDYTMELPGIKISIGAVGFEKLSVRQPQASFADYLDRRMTRPVGSTADHDPRDDAGLAGLISAFGVGRFSIDHFAVDAIGIDRLGFTGFHVSGLSSDAVAELGLDGFEGAIEGQGSIKLGHFALGGAKLPGAEAVISAWRAGQRGEDVDFSALAPTFAYVEIADGLLDSPDFSRLALGRLRLDLANYVGSIPTTVTADIAGLDMPTRMLPNRIVAGLLTTFGYDRVAADAGVKMAWNEAGETMAIDGLRFDMKNMGVLTGTAALSGLTRQVLEQSGSIIDALPGTLLTGGAFTFKDESLVDNGLAYRAKAAHADPEKLRKQLATALPFMLGFLGNPDFQKQVGPVLKAFLLAPGTITARLAPPSPVAIPEISKAVLSAPQNLPNLLGITVTGEARPSPPSPANPGDAPPAPSAPAAKQGAAGVPDIRPAIDP